MSQQSSYQTPRWGQLISPVVGDLLQYQTAACACLLWRHTAIIDPPHASLKQSHWRGSRGDSSCLFVFMWNLPCDAVMWWTALLHPKIPMTKFPTWQRNCIDLVPSLQYYNIIKIIMHQSLFAGCWRASFICFYGPDEGWGNHISSRPANPRGEVKQPFITRQIYLCLYNYASNAAKQQRDKFFPYLGL